LRALLAREAPRFDLDDAHDGEDTAATAMLRCTEPILAVAHEVSLATRLTTAASRHVLDAVAHAALRSPASPTREEWDAWRNAHMVVAARVRAYDGDTSLALTLHAALVKLDGHPIVDAVHVAEASGETTVVTVRVTLRADASARYAFGEADRVVSREGDAVDVVRGLRRWPLTTTRRPSVDGGVPWSQRLTDRSRLAGAVLRLDDERVIPNAPYLTVDVLQCFDARHWTAAE
jgi:hypothetical protein